VSGVVTLEGKPLADADVYFQKDEYSGFARTDAEGRYRLVQGAAVGMNKVYFSKWVGGEGVNPDPESGMDFGQFQAAAEGNVDPRTGKLPGGVEMPKQIVPEQYNSPGSSKLTYDVPKGGSTSADFDL
jgi:hypothetical protein